MIFGKDTVADMTVLGSNAAYRILQANDLTRVPAGVDAAEAIELLLPISGVQVNVSLTKSGSLFSTITRHGVIPNAAHYDGHRST